VWDTVVFQAGPPHYHPAGAGYSGPPARAALLPRSQVGDTAVIRAGQPPYHLARWGIH